MTKLESLVVSSTHWALPDEHAVFVELELEFEKSDGLAASMSRQSAAC